MTGRIWSPGQRVTDPPFLRFISCLKRMAASRLAIRYGTSRCSLLAVCRMQLCISRFTSRARIIHTQSLSATPGHSKPHNCTCYSPSIRIAVPSLCTIIPRDDETAPIQEGSHPMHNSWQRSRPSLYEPAHPPQPIEKEKQTGIPTYPSQSLMLCRKRLQDDTMYALDCALWSSLSAPLVHPGPRPLTSRVHVRVRVLRLRPPRVEAFTADCRCGDEC
jgi:hypothetical protein